ncbi:MAG: FAD-dependent monooxygenase [Solirubrobacterales bacterium]|nr:FAD-dependent monooxygenase [Solirubrobacterales bacterium]
MCAQTARDRSALDRSESVPVLIVGAGPAGLTLSLLLARSGVESMIVEQRRGLSILPRATGVNLRSMEIYRGLGLQAAIDAVSMSSDVPFMLVGETLAGPPREVIESNHWGPSSDPAWPSPSHANWCAQDQLEAVLLEALTEEPCARLRFANEFMSFRADGGVTAQVRDRDSGLTRPVQARYLIGADGASSRVRDCLGIAMRGQAGFSSELNILFEAELEPLLEGRRFCMYRTTGEHANGVVRPTGRPGRWLFGTTDRPDVNEAQLVRTIRDAAGDCRLPVEIIAAGVWEASARVAESFRDGPVLLLGDAAHQHTPGGGFGMNSAVQAAHNLAWKLAAVLGHYAGDGLLDTYEAERRPLAELTTSLSIAMLRARGRASGRTLGIVLGAHYEYGAVVPDGTPPPRAGDPIADYVPCARPGHRAPHLWLDDANTSSTLDLFGHEFVLLTRDPTLWQVASEGVGDPGIPLRVRRLSSIDDGHLYGAGGSGAVLVRPDGYVAARWPAPPDGMLRELESAFSTVLSRDAVVRLVT